MTRGKVTPYVEPTPNDAEYYFGVERGKLMDAMSRPELYHKLAEAYQLAGALLIGADITEEREGKRRYINGWTEEEVDRSVEVLLNFLSCPADTSIRDLREANYASRAVADSMRAYGFEERQLTSFVIRTANGDRHWAATSEAHAREQHLDAFADEPIISVWLNGNEPPAGGWAGEGDDPSQHDVPRE